MHLQVDKDFVEEIINNKFLIEKHKQFKIAFELKQEKKFLDENPDFVQMMMNLAQSEKIRIVE